MTSSPPPPARINLIGVVLQPEGISVPFSSVSPTSSDLTVGIGRLLVAGDMGEESSSPSSFLMGHWEGWKEFWSERLSFLDNYGRFIKLEKPLPSWSSADVKEFIASDPFNGPVLKTARDAAQFGLVGGAVGAVTTAGFAWKYSKSLHGAGLSFVAGAVFGWTFGQEIANHRYQLYRLDTMQAQVKFLEWWKNKTKGAD